jgi:hypothetical protein
MPDAVEVAARCDVRLARLTRLRAKAFAIGDTERQRSLSAAVVYLGRINDAETNNLLTPERATRLRLLWLSGRLLDGYRLNGPAVPQWIKQQQRAIADRDRAFRALRVHEVRSSRLVSRRALPGGRTRQRPREHRPSTTRRVARTVGARGDPHPGEPDPEPLAPWRGLLAASVRMLAHVDGRNAAMRLARLA